MTDSFNGKYFMIQSTTENNHRYEEITISNYTHLYIKKDICWKLWLKDLKFQPNELLVARGTSYDYYSQKMTKFTCYSHASPTVCIVPTPYYFHLKLCFYVQDHSNGAFDGALFIWMWIFYIPNNSAKPFWMERSKKRGICACEREVSFQNFCNPKNSLRFIYSLLRAYSMQQIRSFVL